MNIRSTSKAFKLIIINRHTRLTNKRTKSTSSHSSLRQICYYYYMDLGLYFKYIYRLGKKQNTKMLLDRNILDAHI